MVNQNGKNQTTETEYDGSEMDDIKSPPFKMFGVFIIISIIGVLYTYLWSLAMTL